MIHNILKDTKIVLASASPRRIELLRLIGLSPLVVPSMVDEDKTHNAPHREVMLHAINKTYSVVNKMDRDALVVGADTLVAYKGKILGKPEDANQAAEFLQLLSGETHSVYTGVCVYWRNQCLTDFERSQVRFKQLSDQEISDYIQTHEPMDKAGAYGIQGFGSQFIVSVKGCYFNVMGLPINLFYRMIQKLDSRRLSDTLVGEINCQPAI